MGWISKDGMHLSGEGHVVLVDALAGAGFEPSEPPS
jgi:lysophospholipase L1-like esterase